MRFNKFQLATSIFAMAMGALTACSKAEQNPPPGPPPPPPVVPPPGPPPPPPPPPVMPNQDVTLSGYTYRLDAYLTGSLVPVPNAAVQALGTNVTPVASRQDGYYSIDVPQNGYLILNASNPDYLSTYEYQAVANQDITKNFLMAYENHVSLFSQRFGVEWDAQFDCHEPNLGKQCRYAVIMGRVVDDGTYDNGTPTPLAGVQKEDFSIASGGYANWYKKGPYFFFFNGQPDEFATGTKRRQNPMTNKYEGGLYVTYVEVPLQGPQSLDFDITINSYAEGPNRRYFGPTTIKAFRGGFTWAVVPETGIATPPPPPPGPPPPPPPPPPPIGDVDFDQQVYPLFAGVNQGGLGCTGCHTDQGGATPAGGLNLYQADNAYAALNPQNYPQRVNLQNPDGSYLLTKPLYEVNGQQDHPIFAFTSVDDPSYKLIRAWIAEGAVREGGVPPPPVSFYNDVRPILIAQGFCNCHLDQAQGGLVFDSNDANALYEAIVNDTPSDNGATGEQYRINKNGETGNSLLLLNPYIGSLEPHPQKIFQGRNQDPRYDTIYDWIAQGYVNDTP